MLTEKERNALEVTQKYLINEHKDCIATEIARKKYRLDTICLSDERYYGAMMILSLLVDVNNAIKNDDALSNLLDHFGTALTLEYFDCNGKGKNDA